MKEEAAKQYGVFTHVSKACLELSNKEKYLYREIDTIRVVGKQEEITTYEIFGFREDANMDVHHLFAEFNQAVKLYKNMKFEKALESFKKTETLESKRGFPNSNVKTPSRVYIDRCELLIKNHPGEVWDGVFELTHK